MSLVLSLQFLVTIECLNAYFDKMDLPHNYFTDTSLAGYLTYKNVYWRMRRLSRLDSKGPLSFQHLFQSLPMSAVKAKSRKYCMLLVTYNLMLELYLEVKRKKLLIKMTQEFPDEVIYANLSEDELENVKSYSKNRQISFLNFNKSDDQSIVG